MGPSKGQKKNQHPSSGNSALERALDIIELFDDNRRLLTLDHIADSLGTSRSSCYRYLRALRKFGLLSTVGNGRYHLGPRIIELERRIRMTDPLLHIGEQRMKEGVKAVAPHGVLLLCSHYEDKVLCIHQEGTLKSPNKVQRSRGVPLPMFEGPASLAILSNLPTRTVKTLYLNNQDEITKSGLGETWSEFHSNLKTIRRQGYAYSGGSPMNLLTGLAAPILAKDMLVGSLCLVSEPKERSQAEIEENAQWLIALANKIGDEVGGL